MKIADLHHPEKNVRRHPEKQIKEMQRSIEKFGQYRPVVVDENNIILAGNGLVMALQGMGREEVDVLKYDNLSENDKKKLMIADNQTASLGVDDYAAVEELLKSLDGDYDVPGYDEDAIKLLVEDAEAVVESIQSYGVYTPEEIDRVNAEKEDREENGFTPVEQTYREPSLSAGVTAPENDDMEKTETKRFVICPHCGEKIYL